jgi:hypothetical protein
MTYPEARDAWLIHASTAEYCYNARSAGHYVTIHDLCVEGR